MKNTLNTGYEEKNILDEENLNSWVQFYSKNLGIDIIFENQSENIAYIDTSDLNNPKVFLNLENIVDKYNFNEREILFIIFHEIEHLKEEIELRISKTGEEISEKRLDRFKNHGNKAKEFKELENIIRDIFVNKQVVHPKNAAVLKDTINSIYGEKVFKQKDYLNFKIKLNEGETTTKKLPKHLQFVYTLIREEMLPEEECVIENDVRKAINKIKRNRAFNSTINGKFEDRLQNIWKYIEPIYNRFLEKDYKELEESKREEELDRNSNKEEGKSGEGCGAGEEKLENQGEGEIENKDEGEIENQGEGEIENKDEGGSELNNGDSGNQNSEISEEINNSDPEESGKGAGPFDEFYESNDELPHIIEDNIGKEELEEQLEKIIEEKIESKKIKSKSDLELERRVKNILSKDSSKEEFEEKKEKLNIYDNYLKELKNIKDSNSKKNIMNEIVDLFTKIKSRRLKPRYKDKGAVDVELGVRLDSGSVASGIADIKSGGTNPEMFEQDIFIEKHKDFVGKFDVTIIADGSGSMDGQENIDQKKAVLLIFESLKKLNDKIKYSNKNFIKSLEFTTEGIIFEGDTVSKIKYKSNDFTDNDRLLAFGKLDYCDGRSTNDYDAIEEITNSLNNQTQEYKKQVKSGKIKKIVLVMSDGDSSNTSLLQNRISQLRKKGVLVYGIGITQSGESIIESYKSENKKLGFGQVCENSENLAIVLKNLLKEHLEKI